MQFLCFPSSQGLLAASNGREHVFNKGNGTAPGDHGAGETDKTPDSNGSGEGSCNKDSKFVQSDVCTGGVMGGCLGLLFGNGRVFHGEVPPDAESFGCETFI